MIQLFELTKSFGDRVLLDHVTWQITARERVGLCGPNGAGKTTLLKMMAGMEEPDSGQVLKPSALTVGYLPQDGLSHAGRTLFDEASRSFDDLLAMKTDMHALEARLGDPSIPEAEHDAMLSRYSDLQERFRIGDGYTIELKTATVLQGLGFTTADFERQTETFSGGWQMRIALAKLLLKAPSLLLLDEPTNHLDLEARNWLEEYLNAYPHAVILVSHDRFFLDAVVTRIADLTFRTLTDYVGNYSSYLVAHETRMEQLRKAKREQDEEVARVKMFIDRFRYQATKAAQVQSRIKMLEKVVPIEVPPERKKIHFNFPTTAKSGRIVLELKEVRKAYGDQVIFDGLNLHIERGDRIALVGPNGSGKSTLMRMLSGEEQPDAGERVEGHHMVMQYFAQDDATRMDPAPTVYETLSSGSPLDMVPMIRNILGGFLFSGDDIYKKVRVLSGGERTRLAVARMLLRPSNTLLLDEPTNHLDLDSKEVLLDALVDYGGTLIFVSHDRYFVERLATKTIEVGGGKAIIYPGTYREFLWHKEHKDKEQAAPPKVQRQTAPPPAARTQKSDTRISHEEKKRLDTEARKVAKAAHARKARIDTLETRIAETEAAIKHLEQQMSAPGFYDNRDAAQPVIEQHQALMWTVGDLMHQWEELHTLDETASTTAS
ncbi:MAG: ABC-F family ATP-binding cassette domain-containing protein [Acidobacteriaceae bacterium]|jgi:ATP-binding cassette subfamily F protein 3|nr:ABC-F family ATP-binding cassette domain-containing protein [Acidobacteriaceae bacterium]